MKVVVNTGPLVFLSKIDRLSILQKLGNIFVPKKVMTEIQFKKDDVSEAVIMASNDWLKIKTAKDRDLLNVLSKELDGGEAEVICLALEQKDPNSDTSAFERQIDVMVSLSYRKVIPSFCFIVLE